MARLALQTTEIARLLDPRAGQPGGSRDVLAKLAPGQIIRAQVIRSLGDGLFSLNLRGAEVVTASSTPLTPGQLLTLQVNTAGQGQTTLHVVTLVDGQVAAASARPDAAGLEHQALPDQAATRQLLDQLATPVGATTGQPILSTSGGLTESLALAAKLPPTVAERLPAELLDPAGPLARLIERRPELGQRIGQLIAQFADRGVGIGPQISRLADQLDAVLRASAPARESSLPETRSRLIDQLFGADMLERPEELARVLADRLGQLARGLEGNLSRALSAELTRGRLSASELATVNTPVPATAKSEVAADKAPISRDHEAGVGISPKPDGERAPAVQQGAQSDARIVRGVFDGDLKGQLGQLRGQLESLERHGGGPEATIQPALAKVDQLLDQVTSRQIHNLEGLNRYLHVDLPIDPRTGIRDARLEVFYRQSGGSGAQNSDRFTVAMFLNLSKLGDVLAVLTEIDKFVTVGFTVEDESAARLLESNSDLLRGALGKAGHAGASVVVRRAPQKGDAMSDPIWHEFLDLVPQPRDAGQKLNQHA